MLIKAVTPKEEVVIDATSYVIREKDNDKDRNIIIYSGPHMYGFNHIKSINTEDTKYELVVFGDYDGFENAYWYGRH